MKKNILATIKEFFRKLLVKLKKNPSVIPLAMHLAAFVVFSFNLTVISNTTIRLLGKGMGLSEFISMLISILTFLCIMNAFPKRKKPHLPMVILSVVFCGIIIAADSVYLNCILTTDIPITMETYYIIEAYDVVSLHVILMAITAATIILEPVFAKLLKKINTSVELEDTNVGNIELADEE